jgi:hypothetical protein
LPEDVITETLVTQTEGRLKPFNENVCEDKGLEKQVIIVKMKDNRSHGRQAGKFLLVEIIRWRKQI